MKSGTDMQLLRCPMLERNVKRRDCELSVYFKRSRRLTEVKAAQGQNFRRVQGYPLSLPLNQFRFAITPYLASETASLRGVSFSSTERLLLTFFSVHLLILRTAPTVLYRGFSSLSTSFKRL